MNGTISGSFKTDKCKLLQLGNSSSANYYSSNPDELSKSLNCRVPEEKDLRICMVYKWYENIFVGSKTCSQNHANTWHVEEIIKLKGLIFILA